MRKLAGSWELWRALPRTLPYLRPYRRRLIVSVGLTLVLSVLVLAEPWPLAIILDNVLGDSDPGAVLTFLFGADPGRYTLLVFAVVAGFSIVVIQNGFTVLTDYLNSKVEQYMVLDLRSDLFDHCQRLSLTFHDRRQTGALMSQINLQAASLGSIVMAFPPMIEATLTLTGMLIITALIDWQLALLAMAVVPFLYWSFGQYGTRIVPRLQHVQQLEYRSLSIVHEAMAMLRVIVSFGREDHEHRRFREQAKTAVDERVKLTMGQNLYTLAIQTLTALGTSAVLGFGAWHVIQGKITIGELIVLLAYIASVYSPLELISSTVGALNDQLVKFTSSMELLDTEPEVKESPNAVTLGRSSGHVRVENLDFSYEGRRDTLQGIDFEALPGERIAVVGPTGAGKTTLISLLVRFYDPKAGRILIDGVDIREIALRSLREQISVVLQEPLLFSGSIAENIRYGRLEASMDEVMQAARAANAHEFISGLPEGYETELGERGAQLSGGERQRICVARAFLKDAPILILDEPTSSIDSRTEGVILDALDELMVGRTSLIVAHRLSTVRHADRILVINDGRLEESGTHDELVAHEGLYRQLYDAQSRERRTAKQRAATERLVPANGNGADPAVAAPTAVDGEPVPQPTDPPRVNLRTATFEDLREIGMSVTQSIRVLSYREAPGAFASVDEFDQIPGFPQAQRAELKRRLMVAP